MLKQYANILRRFLILSDVFIVVFSFFAAYMVRKYMIGGYFYTGMYFINSYIWILAVVVSSLVGSMYLIGMYRSFRLKKVPEILWIIFQSLFLSFVVFTSASYVFNIDDMSRSFVALFFGFTVVFLVWAKLIIVLLFRRFRTSGFNFRNLLVVGTSEKALEFVTYLKAHRDLGLNVVGLIDDYDGVQVGTTVEGTKILGNLKDVPKILKDNVIDYAVFIVPTEHLAKIEPALLECELVGVTSSVAMNFIDLRFTMGKETSLMNIPMITFERTEHSISAIVFKRLIDIIVSFVGLVVISPIYFAIILIIKLTSKGPAYFAQERVGLNGRIFKLFKFRTMVVDAEEKLKELQAFNEMKGPAFKMENDPRITKIGRFLRKYSLDELPQLWNVFHGDMSLVGPRPPLPSEVKQYDTWHQRRLSMRPGITCLWQVGGRNRISDFDEWVRLDLKYIDNWSLALDFKILLQTIPAVLSTKGAK